MQLLRGRFLYSCNIRTSAAQYSTLYRSSSLWSIYGSPNIVTGLAFSTDCAIASMQRTKFDSYNSSTSLSASTSVTLDRGRHDAILHVLVQAHFSLYVKLYSKRSFYRCKVNIFSDSDAVHIAYCQVGRGSIKFTQNRSLGLSVQMLELLFLHQGPHFRHRTFCMPGDYNIYILQWLISSNSSAYILFWLPSPVDLLSLQPRS